MLHHYIDRGWRGGEDRIERELLINPDDGNDAAQPCHKTTTTTTSSSSLPIVVFVQRRKTKEIKK
jgi:hypothetical protein